ncbi:AlbA family DNA-binding domain-containing protein [Tellurirhabdus bombi]|uniref:AlbA family DNA-binding domain-containing protein n=1 Tax=Tellurirhabdus bombi TaxID=2907205 RepID=UPI001F1E9934|nr:ATP-binding protein [Tellurirhabdus bombi]
MIHDVAALIKQGEGVQLEFKATIHSPNRIARTLTAFSNTGGGLLVVGISDDGRIVGVESEYREIQKLERATDFFVDPVIAVSYETQIVEGKKVLFIVVEESEDKPHHAIDEQGHRTIYVRSKDKSVPTNKLILGADKLDSQLLQSPNVRNLVQYLRKNEAITVKKYAQLINISEYRASKLLQQLAQQGLLILLDRQRPVQFSLKVSE